MEIKAKCFAWCKHQSKLSAFISCQRMDLGGTDGGERVALVCH